MTTKTQFSEIERSERLYSPVRQEDPMHCASCKSRSKYLFKSNYGYLRCYRCIHRKLVIT